MIDFLVHHTPLLYLTQSLWRDEAFSILFAQRSPASFFNITFEPPVYYVLLHFWMNIFGNNEIIVRCLSLTGFVLATIVLVLWAEKLFKKHWLSWYLPIFFFLNPTLLYYAFEIRAYAWFIFFTVASFYCYFEKKWKLYTLTTLLGLFTHTYMVFVPFVQSIHYLLIERHVFSYKHILTIIRDSYIRSIACISVIYLPWLIKVMIDMSKLKSAWYYPVDMQLVKSVLGNIFLGYEGTPWFLWSFTALLSLLLLVAFFFALLSVHTRKRNSFFFLMIFVPLFTVVGISFFKPLFVNRYVIPATIAQVFLIVFAIESIRRPLVQQCVAICALVFVVGFNIWFPSQHQKLDIRSTVKQVNNLLQKNDVILVDSPLVYFETIYYSQNPLKVFFYNPHGNPFPWYVGDAIVSKSQIVNELPPYPIRAFLIHENGTFEMSYSTNISLQKKPVRVQKL